jgi:hypothetical protein
MLIPFMEGQNKLREIFIYEGSDACYLLRSRQPDERAAEEYLHRGLGFRRQIDFASESCAGRVRSDDAQQVYMQVYLKTL